MATQKRTKIVATLGPASESVSVLARMMRNGMDIARLNFSHGTHEHHELLIKRVHQAARKVGKTVAIMQDLSGPKLRVGELPEGGVKLTRGKEFLFRMKGAFEQNGDALAIPLPVRHFPRFVKRGAKILLDDGKMEVRVVSKGAYWVKARVMQGGTLISHKGVNIPHTAIPMSPVTAKDRADLLFGLQQGVDAVAVSFVQSAEDIRSVRSLITRYEKRYRLRSADRPEVKIIAKIEKPSGVEHFDEILEEVDGILIARGDLALEVGYEQVPVLQKELIAKCLMKSKPVIVATQMLDSMTDLPVPTRAEVSDVANAVIDHADCVMLSQESAVGKFPAETVERMRDVILETERSAYDDIALGHVFSMGDPSDEEAIAASAGLLARMTDADGMLVASLSSAAVRLVSHQREELPIFAITEDPRRERQLVFFWGVTPVFLSSPARNVEELMTNALRAVKQRKLVKKNAKLVVVARQPVGKDGPVNVVQLVQ